MQRKRHITIEIAKNTLRLEAFERPSVLTLTSDQYWPSHTLVTPVMVTVLPHARQALGAGT